MELDNDDNDQPPGNDGEVIQEQAEGQDRHEGHAAEDGPLIGDLPQQSQGPTSGVHPGSIAAARQRAATDIERTRSPTPPRALYRSTTGKGVAFTDEDVIFLVRFLEFRTRSQDGKVDMVTFWKDVATKVCPRLLLYKHILSHPAGTSSLSSVMDEVLPTAQA